jgi:hypothetical protein
MSSDISPEEFRKMQLALKENQQLRKMTESLPRRPGGKRSIPNSALTDTYRTGMKLRYPDGCIYRKAEDGSLRMTHSKGGVKLTGPCRLTKQLRKIARKQRHRGECLTRYARRRMQSFTARWVSLVEETA